MLSVYVKDKSDPSPNVLVGESRKKESENIDTGVKEWQNNYTYKLLESTVKITYKT